MNTVNTHIRNIYAKLQAQNRSAAGLALLLPIAPFILELHSLRRLSTAAFSTLVCLEPAIGTIVGLVLLGQVPHALTAVGILGVVAAGAGSVRSAAREHQAPAPPDDAGQAAGYPAVAMARS